MAADLVVLDMRGVVSYTDFLVIAPGTPSARRRRSPDAIHQELKHADGGRSGCRSESRAPPEARWILMDYLDCVVHVFTPDARDYYRLDRLWGEVPKLEVEQTA